MKEKYVNHYQLEQGVVDSSNSDSYTIDLYQKIYAYLLEQSWFQFHLPEIRQYVEKHVLPHDKKK